MPLSLNLSDFIGSILSHVAHGYVEALTSCLFIALARGLGRIAHPAYRKQHRVR
jgi:hypothetical protein